jgi:phosphate transport system protein
MTRRLLNRKETKIHDLLMEMSNATNQAIDSALLCFELRDQSLAQDIIANDKIINRLQHQVEDECVAAIALYQPVASDLRDLISDTFIAIELERIADHAADIARIVLQMSVTPRAEFTKGIVELGQRCRSMVERAMAAYTAGNDQQAREIAAEDDAVDSAEHRMTDEVLQYMRGNAEGTAVGSQILWVIHNLERIGDRATNIAERVVFMATGKNEDLND